MLELLLDLTRRALEGFVFAAPCVGIWFLGLRFHKKAPPVSVRRSGGDRHRKTVRFFHVSR